MFARIDLSALYRRYSTKYILAFFVMAVVISVAAFASRARLIFQPRTSADLSHSRGAKSALKSGYVKRGQFPSQLREALRKLGDRLEAPGKERLILSGAISRPNSSASENPFRLILELPNRLRLDEQEKGRLKATVFDGNKLQKIGDDLKNSDKDEIYSLIFDSVDRFFFQQVEGGSAARFLGSGFKLDIPGSGLSAENSYSIYQLADLNGAGAVDGAGGDLTQPTYKLFHFNSKTLLLEGITYKDNRNGVPVNVAVILSNWNKINNQHIPGLITRLEDMKPVLILKIGSVSINKKENDGIFATGN